MTTLIVVCDAVSLIGFAVAALLCARFALGTKGPGTATLVLMFAMLLYVFVGASNVLEHAGITDALDYYEDYAEIVFAPLVIMSAFAGESETRIAENRRANLLLQRQNDMLMSIVDTSPGGILIIAPGGQVTFANDSAKNMLRITENPDTGLLQTPDWSLTRHNGSPTSLGEIVQADGPRGQRVVLTLPDATRLELLFSVTQMNDASNDLGGAVVAVEQAGPR